MENFRFPSGIRAVGVSIDAENPRVLLVSLSAPPGDDDIRALHEMTVHRPAEREAKPEAGRDWSEGAKGNCVGCRGMGVMPSGQLINKGLHAMVPSNKPCPSCWPDDYMAWLRDQ